MPKILINEVDNTSAGTPGRYGNYAVLITGYANRTPVLTKDATVDNPADKVQPDENGVYEFNAVGDFEKVVGYTANTINSKEAVERKNAAGEVTEYHYGNRMAYHLLSLGYPVIYKVIDQVADMQDADFWAVFKDKASYDFRFVSHGLLETCYDAKKHTELNNRLNEITESFDNLAKIRNRAADRVEGNNALVFLDVCEEEFQSMVADGVRFVDNDGLAYSSYILAAGVNATLDPTGNTLYPDKGLNFDLKAIQQEIEQHDRKHVTITTFNKINHNIAELANYRAEDADNRETFPGRGDCIALIELDEDTYCENGVGNTRPEEWIVEGINDMAGTIADAGKYCAMTVPSLYYKIDKQAVKFPGAFHYLACFMNSLRSGFAEWYAAAGYTRGVASYVVDHTSVKLGEIAINTLEPRNLIDDEDAIQPKFACNVIANFRGSYYLWGNRTAAEVNSINSESGDLTAEHFLNIRQLCTTIKKQLYVACRRFTFDPNSDTLWFNFVNAITPTLDAMKADQGVRDYKIVKVLTDKKATLKAKIRIIPIEAVEDFDIEVSLEDSFGGVSVTAEG